MMNENNAGITAKTVNEELIATDSKKLQKKKKIVTTAVAGVLSVALLGTATYAWFVLNNRPTVDALTMSAGTSGSLKVAKVPGGGGAPADGDYSDNITIGTVDDNFCLRPVTSPDGVNFYQPFYNSEGNVSSIDTVAMELEDGSGNDTSVINQSEENGGWIIKKKFYIRNKVNDATDATTDVSFLVSDAGEGTVVKDATGADKASSAVRMSFKIDYTAPAAGVPQGCTASGTTIIFEPNAGVNDLSTAIKYNSTYYDGMTYIAQERTGDSPNYSYKFKSVSGEMQNGDTFNKLYSPTLFTIPNNTDVLVTMYVWLEGTDSDCTNEGANSIEADKISAQLQFIATDDMENN